MNIYNNEYGFHIGNENGYRGFLNRLRLKKFSTLVSPKPNENILEIGCNKAALLRVFQEKGASVVGIDIAERVLDNIQDVDVCYMSAMKLAFIEEYFDKICAFEVLEHILELKIVFENVCRILKPEGNFYLSVPFEIIRGQSAIYDAISIYHNIMYARKLHVHKLNVKKIKQIIAGLPMKVIYSKMIFIPFPSFFMILKKN